MSVKVQSGDKPQPESSDDDEEDTETDDDVPEQMLAIVENVAFHGRALLASAEYQLLRGKGFYITSISWKAKQSDSPFNILEFDAGFEDPKEGIGFRYNVRGLYRNKNGEFTKTPRPLTPEHKEIIFPIIEQTALTTLADLRNKTATAQTPTTPLPVTPQDGVQP
jgi:hypothetical protein